MVQSLENKVSRRYARALIERGEESKKLDKIVKDLNDLAATLDISDDLKAFIKSPLYRREDRINVMEILAKKGKFTEDTRHFLMLLAQRRRLNLLPSILAVMDDMVKEVKGIRDITIVSAKALTKTQEKQLSTNLKKAIGYDVAIQNQVDPSLLGGVVMQYGSQLIDDSLKTKLEKLTYTMKGTA